MTHHRGQWQFPLQSLRGFSHAEAGKARSQAISAAVSAGVHAEAGKARSQAISAAVSAEAGKAISAKISATISAQFDAESALPKKKKTG